MGTATYDAAERQATAALDQALIVRGGLLLPSGMLEIDNTTSYFSASSDHLSVNGFALLPVLVVGDIASERVREDYLLPNFTARLGLPHKFQMDFAIPYGYELIRSVDATGTSTSSSNFGMGDISAGLYRQLTTEHGQVPDLFAAVRFKSTTGADSFTLTSSEVALGTGFNAIQGNLTVAKSSDPVVFFGNLSYTGNLPANHTIQRTTRTTQVRRHWDTSIQEVRRGSNRIDPGVESRRLDDIRMGPTLYPLDLTEWRGHSRVVSGGGYLSSRHELYLCAG